MESIGHRDADLQADERQTLSSNWIQIGRGCSRRNQKICQSIRARAALSYINYGQNMPASDPISLFAITAVASNHSSS